MSQWTLASWSLVPLPFLNPAWTSVSSVYCWNLTWRILNIVLLVCEMSEITWQFKHSLALPFYGTGMKTDLFQSCGHCWVFQCQFCWHIECSTFIASSFGKCAYIETNLRNWKIMKWNEMIGRDNKTSRVMLIQLSSKNEWSIEKMLKYDIQ